MKHCNRIFLLLISLVLLFNRCNQEEELIEKGIIVTSFEMLTDPESEELFQSIDNSIGSGNLDKSNSYLIQGEISQELISSILEEPSYANARMDGCTAEKYCKGNDLWIKMSNCEKRLSQQNYPGCMSSSSGESVESGATSSFIILTGGSADGFFQETEVNFVGGGGSGSGSSTGSNTSTGGAGTSLVVIPIPDSDFEEVHESFGELECTTGIVNEMGLCVAPCVNGLDESGN